MISVIPKGGGYSQGAWILPADQEDDFPDAWKDLRNFSWLFSRLMGNKSDICAFLVSHFPQRLEVLVGKRLEGWLGLVEDPLRLKTLANVIKTRSTRSAGNLDSICIHNRSLSVCPVQRCHIAGLVLWLLNLGVLGEDSLRVRRSLRANKGERGERWK